MRVEAPQQSGDGALVKGLFGGDRIGGVPLHQRIGIDDAFHLAVEVVLRGQDRGGNEQNCGEAKHQSGQIPAISTWTSGNAGVSGRLPPEGRAAELAVLE